MRRVRLLACIGIASVAWWPLVSFGADGITLLLVPREEEPVRSLGMDVAARYPSLLLSYKILPNGTVSLHGWSGTEWVSVTPESYESGAFFSKQPSSAVLVCKADNPVPDELIPNKEWCPAAYKISTTAIRPLLHLLGRHYDYKYEDWKWFADNYKMPINRINPEGLNIRWYHQRLGDRLKKSDFSGEADLKFLSVIFMPQTEPIEQPEIIKDEPGEDPAILNTEPEQAVTDNPLTNAVPDAVILGAGEANEAVGDGSEQRVEDTVAPGEDE